MIVELRKDLPIQQTEEDSDPQTHPTPSQDESSGSHHTNGEQGASLRKELNTISGAAFVVGETVGSGIFITTSSILTYTQSFGLTLVVWAVGGLLAFGGALCFCELGVLVRKSGSGYAYILEAYSFRKRKPWLENLGSLMAFLSIWTSTVIGQPTAIAIITLSFARYVFRPFFIGCPEVPIVPVKLLALSALLFLCIINVYSVRVSAWMMTALTFLKLLALVFVIALGVWYVIDKRSFPEDSRHPFAGSTTSVSAIALALYNSMWAYDGWDTLNQALEESKNINRILPRVTFLAMPTVMLFYLLVNVAFFAVLSYEQIEANKAVGLVFGEAVLGKAGLVIIPLLVALVMFGAAHASLFAAARQVFAASRDGIFPKLFSGIHVTFRTPTTAVLLHTLTAGVWISVGTIDELIDAFSASSWVFYGLAIGGIFIMRITHKDVPRPFEVWLIVPSCMLLASIFLVVVPLWQSAVPQLVAFGGILLGVPVHVLFVMEKPWRLKPKVFDRISECILYLLYVYPIAHADRLRIIANDVLNTQTAKSF